MGESPGEQKSFTINKRFHTVERVLSSRAVKISVFQKCLAEFMHC